MSKKILASLLSFGKKMNVDLFLPSFYYMNKTHRILYPHRRVNKNPLFCIHLDTMIYFQCVFRSEAHDKKKINNNNNNNNNNKISKKETKIKL